MLEMFPRVDLDIIANIKIFSAIFYFHYKFIGILFFLCQLLDFVKIRNAFPFCAL